MTSSAMSRAEIRRLERRAVELARVDFRAFARYVLRLKNQPFHDYMNAIVDSRQRVTFDAPIEHGKTGQFSIARPLFELGRNPNQLIAIVSATPELPRRSLGVVRQHLEENDRLKAVFPRLRLVEDAKFAITVERPAGLAKDASIVAMGIEGAILGRRWTWLVTDDILRLATTWSDHEREKTWQRLAREMFSRLTLASKHVDIGTPWVQNDARHRMRRLPGYLFLRFDGWSGQCLDSAGKEVASFPDGLWPEVTIDPVTGIKYGWPRWRLEQARDSMPGYEFDRQIRCVALSEAMDIFWKHLDHAMELGRGVRMDEAVDGRVKICWREPEPHWRHIFTGVDLAIKKAESANDTCFYTGAVEDRTKHLIEIRRGKMDGPDILRAMISIVRHYPDHRGFRVETNQAQEYILQFAREPGLLEAMGASKEEAARIDVFPHVTSSLNKDKEGIGIRSMSVEFERGRWPIPCDGDRLPCELVQRWVDGLRAFDPVGHADDSVIASWLFCEQARAFGMGGSTDWQRFGIYVPG